MKKGRAILRPPARRRQARSSIRCVERQPPDSAAHLRELNADGTWQHEKRKRFNSAILATPDGRVRGVYAKRDLVMLGEYIPAEDTIPWMRRLLPWAGTFSPGASSAPLDLDGRRILVLICYEDVMPERVCAAVDEGDPDLLVNLTSDAWFGQSRVPWLHLALAKLRAIEHRHFLVRATNTGVSVVVDPACRIVTALPPNQPASLVATVRWMHARTPYEVAGDAPCMFVVAMTRSIRARMGGSRTTTDASSA